MVKSHLEYVALMSPKRVCLDAGKELLFMSKFWINSVGFISLFILIQIFIVIFFFLSHNQTHPGAESDMGEGIWWVPFW